MPVRNGVRAVDKVELSQVGYVEHGGADGHSGNVTKFWAAECPSLQGSPWCACGQRWSFDRAGCLAYYPKADNPYLCASLWQWAQSHGLARTKRARRGDLVIYGFAGNGVPDHVEWSRRRARRGSTLHVIGFNTSAADGDQRNGGEVAAKTRPFDGYVIGAIRTSDLLPRRRARHLWLKKSEQPAPASRRRPNPYHAPRQTVLEGSKGAGVRWVQWAAGAHVDGIFGTQTRYAVELFQRHHNLAPDGIVGPQTRAVLAKVRH